MQGMQAWAVGEPAPEEIADIDGVTFSYDPYAGFRALVVLRDPHPGEREAFHGPGWRFTFARDAGHPFVIVEVGRTLAGESPLTPYAGQVAAADAAGVNLADSVARYLEPGTHAVVSAVLITNPGAIVAGLRVFTLGADFTRKLCHALADAYAGPPILEADLMGLMARHAERWPNPVDFAKARGLAYCRAGD